MELKKKTTYELNNGIEIPILGLGTYMMKGSEATKSIKTALELGYRLIDTASFYDNEEEVGQAIKESGLDREEIFLTTKVWNTEQGYEETKEAFQRSLNRLQTDYVDLYLIHWPVTGLRNETWKTLEEIYEEGDARAIGVSNYTIQHLKGLLDAFTTKPVVNQVEFSPFLYQKDLLNFCKKHNIYVEAYCPLTRAEKLKNPAMKNIGEKYEKTPAQIMIRWGLEHNLIEIPKSSSKEHLEQNIDVFDFSLDKNDMETLNQLDEGFRIAEDPHNYE